MAEPAVVAAARPGAELSGHLAMLGFAGLVAGSFSLGGLAANEIDPTALTVVRFVMAAALLLAMAALGPGLKRAHLRAPWRYPLLGTLFGAYFVLMFEALKTASPVSTAAVFTLTPLMAAGFGWVILGQRLTARIAVALGVGAVGAVWVIFRADLAALLAFQPGRGEAVFFVGCISHALLIPLMRRLNRGEPPLVSNALVMVGGLVVLALVGLRPVLATDWAALPPIVWITAVYLAVAATAMSFALLQHAAMRLPAAKVMAYTFLVPSFVIAWELALGNPPPPVLVLPGIGLTTLAVLLLFRR